MSQHRLVQRAAQLNSTRLASTQALRLRKKQTKPSQAYTHIAHKQLANTVHLTFSRKQPPPSQPPNSHTIAGLVVLFIGNTHTNICGHIL